MPQDNLPKLVKLYGDVLYGSTGIGLHDRQIKPSPEKFVAIGLEKSKTAEHIEDEDCNVR